LSIQELLRKGLLAKALPDKGKVEGSLQISERFIERAEANLEIKLWDVAFLMAYNSMFHSGRALLFANNLKERSHQALILALKEIYAGNLELVSLLKSFSNCKIARHSIQYDGSLCSGADAEEALKDANAFLKKAQEILKGKDSQQV